MLVGFLLRHGRGKLLIIELSRPKALLLYMAVQFHPSLHATPAHILTLYGYVTDLGRRKKQCSDVQDKDFIG